MSPLPSTEPPTTTDSPRRAHGALLASLGVIAAIAIVYVPSALSSGFVYDDLRFIVDNPHVLRPGDVSGWIDLLVDPHTTDPMSPTGIVRPLRTFEFAVDHALFRLSPAAFHLHSVAWHALASVLVLALLRRLTGRLAAATAGALVFALHPMQVEAVALVASRGDVAMGACVVGALVALLRETRRGLATALVLSAVAMLYKETAVVVPLLVFAVRLVCPAAGPPGRIRPALRASFPFLLVAAAYLLARASVQVGGVAHVETFVLGGGTAGTFATMFRGFGAYLLFVIMPVAPALDWYLAPSGTLASLAVIGWLAVHVGLVVAAIRCRTEHPSLSAAICFFYFPLIPVANWPFSIGIPTAERFLYLSVIGAGLIVASVVGRCGRRALPAAALAVVALGLAATVRTQDWSDNSTLMAATLEHGRSPRAHSYFGARAREEALVLRREASGSEHRRDVQEAFERALDHVHRSLDLWHQFEMVPSSTSFVVVEPHINAANLCLYLGRPGEALWHADRAVAAKGNVYPHGPYNRALALLALDRPVAAVHALERAVELGMPLSDGAFARNCVRAGTACMALGATQTAAAAFELARTGAPLESAQGARGALLATDESQVDRRAGTPIRWDEMHGPAAARLVPALTAAPRSIVRDYMLACAYEELGRDAEALKLFLAAGTTSPLNDTERRRCASSVERIQTGCRQWRDHSLSSND